MSPSDQSAHRLAAGSRSAQSEADHLLGEFSAFLQQVGVRGLGGEGDSTPIYADSPVQNFNALRALLDTYFTQVLLPIELPAIVAAYQHARRGETRELIALDVKLAGETRLAPFASASRCTGATQLRRLKPLRDERTVQRYLAAVSANQASGWHTLVYGLTAAVFALPLRQALLHYGRETISALARAAAGPGLFADGTGGKILDELLSRLPAAVEKNLPPNDAPSAAFRCAV